ncbi:glycoside hydrolase family 37 protein [Cylindrobasidium torrendii FP15055 ss-10]|uniref:Trehalase n=1 Tax=Cylindrobasidium torrendii FP15055 ss-10 TaxID=1314674 RepID=A0A0D7B3E5_9AGAR|nr:glycoside hydrolase family 37 protein [Cylindrobasidium torrendii FP15055 ss-10]
MISWLVVGLALNAHYTRAAPGASSSVNYTVTTAVASPSASAQSALPSQVALPPTQAWCPSEIFCAGELLQTVNLAVLYPDPKTFVDKPTSKNASSVLADFDQLQSPTVGDVANFVSANFSGEGLELQALTLENFNENPPFLDNVTDPVLRAWSQTVHGYWTQLIRGTNSSTLCDGVKCESSLIPLNHTFVVPGGRFREQYYWDSFWIVEGLLESQLYDIVNATLQNFMDELEQFGFIPNGGRIYYLNRSQPPLFVQMLERYVTVSGDTGILSRALPLAEREFEWWRANRTVSVTSPTTGQNYSLARYAVNNSAPRPESYLTDYKTANNPDGPTLTEDERSSLYAELASGAESGWDYSTRWLQDPAPGNDNLTTLQIRELLPVDLNSILYKNHVIMAQLYGSANDSAASVHREAAASIKEGILDLMWNTTKYAFYDYSLTGEKQTNVLSAAAFYPFWSGIVPDEVLLNATNAFRAFSSVNLVLNRYNGTYPSTFLDTGLQWDFPNAWPPHQYIVLEALKNLPSNVTSMALPTNGSSFELIPEGQLGLTEAQLPAQTLTATANATVSGLAADIHRVNGTVTNGGNATEGEGWADTLARELANRYFASSFCSWRATGGSIPDILPRLSEQELNVTLSVSNTGNMFEKFSSLDIDSAGRGGEYTVQAGFGWTNGVVIWAASAYGSLLVEPQCPSLLDSVAGTQGALGADDASVGPVSISLVSVLLSLVLTQILFVL